MPRLHDERCRLIVRRIIPRNLMRPSPALDVHQEICLFVQVIWQVDDDIENTHRIAHLKWQFLFAIIFRYES